MSRDKAINALVAYRRVSGGPGVESDAAKKERVLAAAVIDRIITAAAEEAEARAAEKYEPIIERLYCAILLLAEEQGPRVVDAVQGALTDGETAQARKPKGR